MKNPLRPFALLAALAGASLASAAIEQVTVLTARPERFGRVDFDVLLTAEWTNPFRSAEVALDLELVAPSGRRLVLPAYHVSGRSGELSIWHARFAPAETGEYRGAFVLAGPAGREASAPLAFTVAASARRGFLHPRDHWTFQYDDGTPFRALGENLGWEARADDDSKFFRALHQSPRYHYEYMLGTLAAHGGNFFRTWMCSWNLPLEWHRTVDTDRYTPDDAHFNASAARRLDELVALADSLGVHLMLTLDTGSAFLGRDWALNSYNRANGGPAATALEFFTAPAAKAQYRDRLRYLVARWGWSPSIAAWEFFNEIDNLMYGVEPRLPDAVVTAWHDEMSRHLRQLDPYGRLITTSISHRDVEGLNNLPAIDFNQRHIYRNTAGIPATLRDYTARTGRPYVIGEFGYEWDWNKNFDEFAPEMDRDFRRGLWFGLFSPTPILPLSWWWEWFDARGRTADFAPVRTVLDRMLAAGHGSFAETECTTGNPAVPALAVRCGASTFVYLWQDSATPLPVTVSLPPAPASPGRIRSFQPTTGLWTEHPAAPAPEVTVPAHGDLVVVFE